MLMNYCYRGGISVSLFLLFISIIRPHTFTSRQFIYYFLPFTLPEEKRMLTTRAISKGKMMTIDKQPLRRERETNTPLLSCLGGMWVVQGGDGGGWFLDEEGDTK